MANDWQSALKYPTVYRLRGAFYPALFIVLLITARRWFPLTSSCLFLLCRHIRSVTRSSAFSRTWRQSRGRRRKENPRCCHRDPFLASLHPTLSSPPLPSLPHPRRASLYLKMASRLLKPDSTIPNFTLSTQLPRSPPVYIQTLFRSNCVDMFGLWCHVNTSSSSLLLPRCSSQTS